MATSGTGLSQAPEPQAANQTTATPGTNAGNQAASASTPGASSQHQAASAASANNENQQPIPADNQFPRWGIRLFGLYLIGVSFVVLYLLLKFWPENPTATGPSEVWFLGKLRFWIWPETRNLWLAITAGALGSYVHLTTSFVDFAGNRKLAKSWIWWYLLRPFIGGCLALLVYFAIRAGLVTAASGSSALSPYGVAMMAGLAGMFSKQATEKLRELFDNLFKTSPEATTARADPLPPQKPATAGEQKADAAGAGK